MLKDGYNKFNSKSGCVIFAHNHIHLSLLCTWYLFICNGVMTSLIPRLFLLCCALSTSCPGSQCSMFGAMWSLPWCGPWSIFHTQMNIRFNILILSGLNWLLHTALHTGGRVQNKVGWHLFAKHVLVLSFSEHLFEGLALNLCFLVYWVPNNDIKIGCYFSEVQPRTHNHVQLLGGEIWFGTANEKARANSVDQWGDTGEGRWHCKERFRWWRGFVLHY